MKILAMDIGAGTEDVLLYDDRKKSIENCIKIVLPSPSQVFAAKVREATRLYEDIFVKGDVIGGGAFAFALRNHVEKGLRVMMTENAAYTVRNDPVVEKADPVLAIIRFFSIVHTDSAFRKLCVRAWLYWTICQLFARSRTAHKHVNRHNRSVEASSFCPSCRRVKKSKLESVLAKRN